MFYKKTHEEQYAKSMWSCVYKALHEQLLDPTLFLHIGVLGGGGGMYHI